MKTLIFLTFSVVSVFGLIDNCNEIRFNWRNLVEPYHTQCICATGVEKEIADDLLDNEVYADNPCLKCYIACILKHIGIMKHDNTINFDVACTAGVGFTYEIVEECYDKIRYSSDPCIIAYEFLVCASDKDNCSEIQSNWRSLIEPYHTECICATGVQKEIADNMLENFVYADDSCFKCYLNCVLKHLGVMKYDNTINLDVVSTIAAGVTYEIAEECYDRIRYITDPCIISYEFLICVFHAVMEVCADC
ncbi:hypothetical protein FQR65_LT01535 [Abscondita terminalis]|nr:hypothetical protein FQR65_LT01535 [Abscondita terminalis]